MKKRLFLTLIFSLLLFSGSIQPSDAKFLDATRTAIAQARMVNADFKAIQNVIKSQNTFCNKRDYDGLFALYKSEFINNDGFSKDVYFRLVKDTWKNYPDITYKTEILSINLQNNYATVETRETAIATTTEDLGEVEIVGELRGVGHSVYYLEKVGKNWEIASENILDETTTLTYGDARFLDIQLNSPELVGAGKSYSATLSVNAPSDTVVVGSIGQEQITYPQKNPEDVYRKLADDNTLERVFTANKDNINEYNIASVGITRAEFPDEDNPRNIKIYMSGIAFIVTRVNVVPVNNFVTLEDKTEDKDGQKDK